MLQIRADISLIMSFKCTVLFEICFLNVLLFLCYGISKADECERSDDELDAGGEGGGMRGEAGGQKEDGYEYELIGVTVHTGTADGGHYYSFIRDRLNRNELGQDQWYVAIQSFNQHKSWRFWHGGI